MNYDQLPIRRSGSRFARLTRLRPYFHLDEGFITISYFLYSFLLSLVLCTVYSTIFPCLGVAGDFKELISGQSVIIYKRKEFNLVAFFTDHMHQRKI